MRKLMIVAAILLAFAVSAGAQDFAPGITGKGIKVGLNLANHTGSDTDDNHKMRTAFAVGGFMTYALSPAFAVQPEVIFSMKGYKWEDAGWDETGKFSYLEVPILAKYTIPTNGNTKPSLFAGPAVAFLMSAKVDYTFEGADNSEDVKDFTKSIDVGIAFGGGVDVAMGDKTLTVDARYVLGMTKIADIEEDVDVKNSVISVMVGLGL